MDSPDFLSELLRADKTISLFQLIRISGKLLAESLAGEEDAALHRTHGKIQLLGNLAIFITGHVHIERHPEIIIESSENSIDFLHREATLGILKRRLLGCVEKVKILSCVHDSGLTHLTAIIVDEDISHDGENPSLEISLGCVFIFIIKSLQRGVLQQIGSSVAVGSKLISETHEILLKIEKIIAEVGISCHIGLFLLVESLSFVRVKKILFVGSLHPKNDIGFQIVSHFFRKFCKYIKTFVYISIKQHLTRY